MSSTNVNVSLARIARILREAREDLAADNAAAEVNEVLRDINHRIEMTEGERNWARQADDCFCPGCGRRGFRFTCPTCGRD